MYVLSEAKMTKNSLDVQIFEFYFGTAEGRAKPSSSTLRLLLALHARVGLIGRAEGAAKPRSGIQRIELSLVQVYCNVGLHYTRGWELGLVQVYCKLGAAKPSSGILQCGLALHARVGLREKLSLVQVYYDLDLALQVRVRLRPKKIKLLLGPRRSNYYIHRRRIH
ncbi:hypothetical protein TNCV_3603771 [Trichonephila clavipes]|nr:hypothetical protein TNCV_3603771 [Trichonephila clavipes]